MNNQPATITILHELPHRWRLNLSVEPKKPEALIRHVRAHEGIRSLKYNPITRSLVVTFNPEEVSRQEIMMRIAVSLSEQLGLIPVYVLTEPAKRRIGPEVWTSGAVLMTSFTLRLICSAKASLAADWLGGLTTAGAVLEHAHQENRQKGHVDPEVWTLVYLLWSLLRGNPLRAAGITWLTVFGRHLMRHSGGVIEIRPVKSQDQAEVTFTVSLKSGIAPSDRLSLAGSLFESVVALIGGQASRFINDLKHVTRLHDQVLHGMGRFDAGLQINFT